MFSGAFNKADCAKLDSGDLTEDEAMCQRDENGEPSLTRDCIFLKVGDLLHSIPFSFPVSTRLSHSLGWGLVSAIDQGDMENAMRKYQVGSRAPLPPF